MSLYLHPRKAFVTALLTGTIGVLGGCGAGLNSHGSSSNPCAGVTPAGQLNPRGIQTPPACDAYLDSLPRSLAPRESEPE